MFELDNVKNEAMLRDFFIFKVDNIQNEAILRDFPQFLNLTTSKTKQFCETSSIFELDNIKNKTILWDFLQKWKVECNADGLVPMRFLIFPLHLSKVLRLPRKIEARSYEVLHLWRKIILANLQIWCSKMQPLSGNQRPDLLTSLMNMCTAPATRNASLQILFKCPMPAIVFGNATKPSRFAHFWRGAQSLAPATPNDIWTSKSGANMWCFVHFDFISSHHSGVHFFDISTSKSGLIWCVLYILTSKFASHHNGVHFFDISTSKSGPSMVCFVHFDLEMCFTPQRRALFHPSSGQMALRPPL